MTPRTPWGRYQSTKSTPTPPGRLLSSTAGSGTPKFHHWFRNHQPSRRSKFRTPVAFYDFRNLQVCGALFSLIFRIPRRKVPWKVTKIIKFENMFALFNNSEMEPSKSDPKNQKKTGKIDDFLYHPSNPYSRSPQEWPSHSSKHHSWVWGRPHERPLKSGKSTSYHGPTLMQQVPVLRGSQMPVFTDVRLQPFPWRAKLKLRRIKSRTSFQNWLKLLIVCFYPRFDRRQNPV